MLSVAYGTDQRDANSVHYPEVCYPAQGFEIRSNSKAAIKTSEGSIAVRRLETSLHHQRYEPVTYWTTVGNRVITGPIDKKIEELTFGLRGTIPDGLIFRISSIDIDTKHAFLIQDEFVNSLSITLSARNKKWLMGLP
jgi:EpsI family protein